MVRVVVIGGGWSGCAAAITARKAGAEVILIEKTDLLLGLGNVGGIMRNNGRYTAAEECIHLGANELFNITDIASRHKNVDFPGHKHAFLYDVNIIEPLVRELIIKMGIKVLLKERVVDVDKDEKTIKNVKLFSGDNISGDVFVETTGSTGPMGNCLKYGNGCAMCILRCPSFGPRVSISHKAGIEDIMGQKEDGSYGAFSGSCKLNKQTLSKEIRRQLNKDGVVILKVPKQDINREKLKKKVCQQYALKEYAENIILLDTGHAKLMAPYYPLEKLRKIKGLDNVKFEDPYSGGIGNSVRYLSIAPRDNTMKVNGLDNLFCAGEKSGLFVGHTEAIATGSLAGNNSVRKCMGLPMITLPRNTACGDLIAFANEKMRTDEGKKMRYTFAGSVFFERMKKRKLYTVDSREVRQRINSVDLIGIYNKKIR